MILRPFFLLPFFCLGLFWVTIVPVLRLLHLGSSGFWFFWVLVLLGSGFFWVLLGSSGALGAFVRAIVLLPPVLHLGSGGAGCVCRGHSPASAFALSASQRREGAFVGAIASLPPSHLSCSSGGAECVCWGHSPASAFALSASQRHEGAFLGAIALLPP